MEAMRWVWVTDATHGFVKAQLIDEEGDSCKVKVPGSGIREIDPDDAQKVNPPQFDRAEDIAELTYLNEPSVVHNLCERYAHDEIYTYSGLFLVAVNPYQTLDLYGPDAASTYHNAPAKRDAVPPHIFAVAEHAYRKMGLSKHSQSILVTGESGAGKTETTKKVIQYLSSVTASHGRRSGSNSPIDERILQTNPVLEAFGNAQTIRNPNSSRFGKFIRIKFNKGKICGAQIEWYLLEKSRVVTQAANERNYHVFYQLVRGASPALRKRLELTSSDPKDYAFLSGVDTISGVDDKEQFENLLRAFQVLDFAQETVDNIFEIIAAVLHLGQIKVGASSADQGRFTNPAEVERAARLLGVPAAELERSILRPRVQAGRELVTQSRTAFQAQFSLGALAKALYERLFGYLVSSLNEGLLATSGSKTNKYEAFIGVLDIAGFEIFEVNSFEQLCINYTNEKLQQFFNHHMFVLEQAEYVQEQIDWEYLDYGADLQPTIDLIESRAPAEIGIFASLDEECVMPQATDQSFTEKLSRRWKDKNSKFGVNKLGEGFLVRHYATDVEYSTDGWLDKNRDPLSEAIAAVMSTSSKSVVAHIFPSQIAKKNGKPQSVVQRHREQLVDLMTELDATQPHFVRCILPNQHRRPQEFDNLLVLEQLRCNGVLEGIRIARAGYPNRLEFSEFCSRYAPLAGEPLTGSTQRACSAVLSKLQLDPSVYKVGLSKVLFRNGVLADLEDRLDKMIASQTLEVQRIARGALVRRHFRRALRRKAASATLAIAVSRSGEMADDSWWKLWTAQRVLLESQDHSVHKDVRIAKLEANLRSLRGELDSTRRKHQVASEASEKELEKIHREAEEARGELTTLRESADASAQESITNASAAAEAQDELNKLRTKTDELGAEYNAQNNKLSALTSSHDALLKEHEALRSDYRSQVDANEVQQRELSQLKDSFAKDLETSRSALESEISSVREATSKELTELAAMKTKLENSNKSLREELEEITSRHQKELSDKSDMVKNAGLIESELKAKLADSDRLHQQELARTATKAQGMFEKKLEVLNEILKEEREKHEATLSDLQAKLSDAASSMEQQHEVESLKEQLAKSVAEHLDLEKKYEPLKSDYDTLKDLHRGLLGTHKELVAKHEELKHASQAPSAELEAVKADLSSSQQQCNKLAASAEASSKKRDEVEKSLAASMKELNDTKELLTSSKQAVESKERALTTSRKELNEAKSVLEASQKDLIEVKASLTSTQKSLKETLAISQAAQAESKATKTALSAAEARIGDLTASITASAGSDEKLVEAKSALKSSEEKLRQTIMLLEASEAQNGELKEIAATSTQTSKLEIEELKASVTSSRAAENSFKLKMAAIETSHNAKLAEVQARLDKANQELKNLRDTNPSDAAEQLVEARQELAQARAQIKDLKSDRSSQEREVAQATLLRKKMERLEREKSQLVDERSRMMFSVEDLRGHNREMDVVRAKAAEATKLQSEIRVLKLRAVKAERDRDAMESRLESTPPLSSESLDRKLRAAELAKVQLQTQVQHLLTQVSDLQRQQQAGTHRRLPSMPQEADLDLVVRKRDVPSALKEISNDRRVSQSARDAAADAVKRQDLTESLEIYRKRADHAHAELEKAEVVVAAAVRNEDQAQQQVKLLRKQLEEQGTLHSAELKHLTEEAVAARKQAADFELELSVSRENASFTAELESQVRSLSSMVREMQAERERDANERLRLERRLSDAVDLSDRPRRLAEQVTAAQRETQNQLRVTEELRWKMSRQDRLVAQLKGTLADSDKRENQLRESIERLQAADAAKDVQMRRLSREITQARQHALLLEKELDARRPTRSAFV